MEEVTEIGQSEPKSFFSSDSEILEPRTGWFRSWFPYLRWVPSSPEELKTAEENLVKYIKTPSEGFYVNVGSVNEHVCHIWTRKFTTKAKLKQTPLVMMHGMGAGLAMFALNIDELCKTCDVYAIDLPGFARSSRPNFSCEHEVAEQQYVVCLEEWRKAVGLPKINLLGHSFGAFLSSSYALKYPQHLENVILVDPWGMSERPKDLEKTYNIPMWVKAVFSVVKHFNPLAGFRAAGPAAPRMVQRFRPDLMRKYEGLIEEDNLKIVAQYLFHCNAHHPSGESAFHSMMTGMAWAKSPMVLRLKDRDTSVPMTILYGSNSWVTAISEEQFEEKGASENLSVYLVENAGHHVYADQAGDFNRIVSNVIGGMSEANSWIDLSAEPKSQPKLSGFKSRIDGYRK
eukprot:TRINITY_DN28302_c0_g1_i1.p1 TRINITY_DN28302_c0_g1~~TRINITY_DN28302_c0_g1_i1.p1  ORF type:complete len:400 (+),score=78.35 TRINITY_DN28302_c0_g1_i1:34-1233(+)